MLNLPVLDDQRFEDIVTEAKNRIPQLCAEWTDFNEHDPGITLIELFAWYKQMQQYHLDQITADHLRMFLKLMGIVPEPVRETRANLLAAGKGIQEPFACGERLYSAGGVVFELEESWNPGHVRLCAAYAGRNERPDDITGLLNQWKVFYTLTREETLYLGFSFSGAKTDLELWVEIDDRHPSPRNRPAGPDDPPPRIFVIEAMDGARAVPVQVLRDETFALSFSGSLSLRLKEPLGVSDAGMGLPKFCWLRLRITDPGCEEDPAILGIAAGCGRLVQRQTRAESGDFTVSCGETASVELYTRLAASGERDLFVRDGRGWRLVSAAMEPAVRDGIAGVRCSFSAQDAAQDGAPNVRLCCRERDFAVRRAHTGLPGGRIDLLDGEETAATGCLTVSVADCYLRGLKQTGWILENPLEDGQAVQYDGLFDGCELGPYLEVCGEKIYDIAADGQQAVSQAVQAYVDAGEADIIVTLGTEAAQLGKLHARDRVPVLAFPLADAVGSGIVKGEQYSGIPNVWAYTDPERYQRQLVLYHDLIPFKKLGLIYYDEGLGGRTGYREAAAQIGIELVERRIDPPPVSDGVDDETALISRWASLAKISGDRYSGIPPVARGSSMESGRWYSGKIRCASRGEPPRKKRVFCTSPSRMT